MHTAVDYLLCTIEILLLQQVEQVRHNFVGENTLWKVGWSMYTLNKVIFFLGTILEGVYKTWTQSYEFDLQRQRCKFLQRHG
jgi:hypothetical protein